MARKQLIGVDDLEVNHQQYVRPPNFDPKTLRQVTLCTRTTLAIYGQLGSIWVSHGDLESIFRLRQVYLGYAFASAASGIKAYSALPLCSYSAISSATITLSLTTFS